MLIVAAAVFYYGPHQDRTVADITTAYKLLAPAIGAAAPKVFAVALLASGQQATITGKLPCMRYITILSVATAQYDCKYEQEYLDIACSLYHLLASMGLQQGAALIGIANVVTE
jgi:hypothetical protein